MDELLPIADAARCLSELGHPRRLQIFNLLARVGGAGCKVGEVQKALGLAKSTLSHHLAELAAAGLISQTREGRVLRCRIETERARQIQAFIARCCEGLPVA